LEKEGVWVWCFDGEFVVECVVDVVANQWTFWRQKMRHDFELYFQPVLCLEWLVALENSIIFAGFGFDFDSEQIRFLGGHPFACRWRSYYQQGFK
jgi:hypothetical protein